MIGLLYTRLVMSTIIAYFSTITWLMIDKFFPLKKIDISSSDKEWITPKIKILIKQRQRAHVIKNYDLRKHSNKKIQQEIWKDKLNYNKKKAHLFHQQILGSGIDM